MDYLKKNKKPALVVLLLIGGLLALLYLVQIKQIFKSKASFDISGSLDMDNQTQEMIKDENKNNGVPTYTISGDRVMIKLKDGTVENINQALEPQKDL